MSGIGGDIKVTLTLDDNGFSANTEKASKLVKSLNAALKDSGSFSEQFEKALGGLSGDMKDFGARFGSLESSLAKFTASITSAVGKLGAIADRARGVKASVNDLSASFSPVGKNAAALSKSVEGIGVSMAQIKPSIAQAISSINQLGDAQKRSAATAKQAQKDVEAAKIAELENEIATNKRIIAERSQTYDQLSRLATELENRALGARVKAEEELAIAQRIIAQGQKAALTSGKQSYVKGAQTSAAPYLADAEAQQAEANRLEQNATAARLEALAIGELIQAINTENAERSARISAIERDAEALAALTAATNEAAAAEQRFASLPILATLHEVEAELDKAAEAMHLAAVASLEAGDDFVKQQVAAMGAARAAEELAAAEERAAEAARAAAETAKQRKQELEDQNAAMRAQADILKSLGSAWAAFKIEDGFKAAISTASQLDQQKLQVQALNIGPQQEAEFFSKALDASKASPYLSYLDAVKTRLSAISSIGSNNAKLIDDTIGRVTQVAQNLTTMGLAHDDLQTSVRNIYGVAEARGQINDANQTNQTADLVERVLVATAGKVTASDLEQAIRRLQPFSQQISDTGLEQIGALIDITKTAGGEGGGGGSGASTIGTSLRALLTYFSGGRLNNEAVKEFADAGLLNTDGIDFSKRKQAMNDLRYAGLKDSDVARKEPITYLQQIRDAIVKVMDRDPSRYYAADADRNDPQVQQDAMEKFFNRLGLSKTAVQAFSFGTNPAITGRINEQVQTAQNVKSSSQIQQDKGDSFRGQWDQTTKNLSDLAGTVGKDLEPAIVGVLKELNQLLATMNSIAENHPFVTQISAAATALLGVKLAIQGITGVFGGLGTLVATLTTFGTAAEGAAAGAAAIGAETAGVTTFFGAFKLPVLTTIGDWILKLGNTFAPMLVSSIGAMSNVVIDAFGMMGKALLRAIPLVGELIMAWDLTKLIGSLEVGGHSVSEWFDHWFSGLLDKAETFVHAFKDTLKGMFTGKGVKWVQSADGSMVPIPDENTLANAEAQTKIDRSDAQKKWQRDEALYNGQKAAAQDPTVDLREAARFGAAVQSQPQQVPQTTNTFTPDPRAQQLADDDGGSRKRSFEDPFAKSLAELSASVANGTHELASLLTRAPEQDQLLIEAMNEFKAKWVGGDFDPGHDPTKRRWKNADGTLNENDPQVQQWVKAEAAVKQLAEEKQALTFANERLAASEVTADEALERLTSGNLSKQTAAFTALEKELARAQERLQEGTKAWADWKLQKDAALFEQSRTDLSNYTADLRQKDKEWQDEQDAEAPNSKRERTELKYQKLFNDQSSQYEALLTNMDAQFQADVGDIQSNDDLTDEAKQERLAAIEQQYYATREANAQQFTEHMKSLWEQYQKDMETPLDQMVKEWKDTDDQIDQQEVQWSNQFMDTFMNFVKTGKFQWQSFVESIGMGVLKTEMQKALADPLKLISGNLGDLIKKYVTGDAASASLAFSVPQGGQMSGALADLDANNANAAMGSTGLFGISGAGGLLGSNTMTTAIQQASSGLVQFGGQLTKSVFSLGEQTAKSLTQTTADAQATSGLQAVASAAQAAASALSSIAGSSGSGGLGGIFGGLLGGGAGSGSGSGSWSGLVGSNTYGFSMPSFANGGIMTQFGEVQLRKYANGGIADSPQLALFGEGSMNEAYVPLPDGRSIPVTMTGGGQGAAPNVSVNVINQTGQQVSAQQASNVRWDGRQAVLDVVLSAATQPGQFRDSLRGAMS